MRRKMPEFSPPQARCVPSGVVEDDHRASTGGKGLVVDHGRLRCEAVLGQVAAVVALPAPAAAEGVNTVRAPRDPVRSSRRRREDSGILLHPALPLVGVSILL